MQALRYDENDLVQFATFKQLPEKRLLHAILYRAIKDLTSPDRWVVFDSFEFIKSPSNAPFSFNWICFHLDLSPLHIQNMPVPDLLKISSSLFNH